MLSVYGTLLANIKSKLLKPYRTNAKLKAKLDEVFDINNTEFKKLASMYSEDKTTIPIFDRLDYENRKIENYKKQKYGDEYVEKPFVYSKTNGE